MNDKSKVEAYILASLIAGSLSCSACIGGGDIEDNCIEYKPQKQYQQPQNTQEQEEKYQVMPMYGVPENPQQYKKEKYPVLLKYGAPVAPKNKEVKQEATYTVPNKNMMLRYAPPMRTDK